MNPSKQPTPDLSHLHAIDYEHVYEPSDDTFLLLDSLEKDKDAITKMNPTICVEVGPGSGCVITFLAQMMGPTRCYFAVDINSHAARATALTAKQNETSIEVINSTLMSPLGRLHGQVDLVIFNPPYVPTPEEELGHTDIVAAWAGGSDGTATLDALMPQLDVMISAKGCFYCVILAQNKPNEVAKRMKLHGFNFAKLIMKQQCIGELLYIVRFSRVNMDP